MDIHELREEIDHIDRQILDLLSKRARCAKEIGVFKTRTKKTFFAPEREKQVLARLTEANKGPLSPGALREVYRAIVETTKSEAARLGAS
jgi:chorismate mutase/prephenate dehydratase